MKLRCIEYSADIGKPGTMLKGVEVQQKMDDDSRHTRQGAENCHSRKYDGRGKLSQQARAFNAETQGNAEGRRREKPDQHRFGFLCAYLSVLCMAIPKKFVILRNGDTSEIGQEIAMRVGNFLDQPVRTQHPQFPAHGCTPTFALGSVGRFTTVEHALQVSIAESVQVEFSPVYRQQEGVVLSQDAQPPNRSALPLGALLQILRQLSQPSCVIDAGQCIRIPFRCFCDTSARRCRSAIPRRIGRQASSPFGSPSLGR